MIKFKQTKNILGGCILKKKIKVFSLCLALVMLVTSLSACNSDKVKKDDIVGQWYAEDGEMGIDVRADGSYDDDGYGTGTWKYLDDGETIEFMDFYGSTKTTIIVKDEYGYSIYNGRYYRDEYPSEKLTGNNNNSNNTGSSNNLSNEQTTGTQKITIDAFAGISYEVTGISPYCEISINNSGCSIDAQERVAYTLDKEYYANGETAIITATITSYNAKDGNKEYVLENEQSTYVISNQPEYVKTVDNNIISNIQGELDDYVTTSVANAIKSGQNGYMVSNLLGCNVSSEMKSVNSIKQGDIYLSVLKLNKDADSGYKNMISFTYQATYTGKYKSGNVYCSISAVNVVKYPDGTIKWGTKNTDDLDFVAEGTETGGMENCITTLIMCNSSNYNISKVEI